MLEVWSSFYCILLYQSFCSFDSSFFFFFFPWLSPWRRPRRRVGVGSESLVYLSRLEDSLWFSLLERFFCFASWILGDNVGSLNFFEVCWMNPCPASGDADGTRSSIFGLLHGRDLLSGPHVHELLENSVVLLLLFGNKHNCIMSSV